MRINTEHMVISIFICIFMISQGIIWGVNADEEPDPNGLYGTRGTEVPKDVEADDTNRSFISDIDTGIVSSTLIGIGVASAIWTCGFIMGRLFGKDRSQRANGQEK